MSFTRFFLLFFLLVFFEGALHFTFREHSQNAEFVRGVAATLLWLACLVTGYFVVREKPYEND